MQRREFLEVLAVAAAAGMPLAAREVLAAQPDAARRVYDLPRFGNVHFLHYTDCHAQLLPIHFREPSVNLGVGAAAGKPPHLVGEALLKYGRAHVRPGGWLCAPRDLGQTTACQPAWLASARRG
jgi:S-sulfosulfanyl-L-cysteine sulfohydrolase